MRYLTLAMLLLIGITGCGFKQSVIMPDMSVAIQDKNKARIYVIRPSQGFLGLFGVNALNEVFAKGRSIGILYSGKYFVWETKPEKSFYISTAKAKYVDVIIKSGEPVVLDLVAGNTYYVTLTIDKGYFLLNQVDDATGRKYLAETDPQGDDANDDTSNENIP